VTGIEQRPAIQLRPYQQEAIAAIEAGLDRGVRRPLVVIPTGAGKTIIFASLIARRGGSALVLAHRDELLRQAADKITQADPTLGLGVGFVQGARDDVAAPVVVASVQTLARATRLARLPTRFDTVIVDEAHHAGARSYRRILEHLDSSPLILGVTATPQRTRGNLGEVWQEIVYQRAIAEMIAAGYLVDVRGIRVGLEAIDLETVAQKGGDFDADQLGDALEQASAPAHVLAAYLEHARDRKTVVFVPTVALAHRMAETFRQAGVAAEALDGSTDPQRRLGILARLRAGETRVVLNVGVLVEGWDEPSVECIVVATPTRSQVKYAQIAGRGLRTFPGKRDCLIIDVVGVTDRLDLQTMPRLFGLREQPAPQVTVTDALEQQHAEDTATPAAGAAGKPTQTGAMRSRQVSVLGGRGRRRSHWLRHDRFWMLSAGNGTIVALAPHRDRPERWAVVQLDRHSHQLIARDVDLAYAHGIAEDHIRQLGARRLADPSAPWRRQPITDNQARTLGRLGIAVPEDATKGQASDLIATHHGAQRLHALSGQRAA
jgi:superfamily II DNA or RNA helicase